MRIAEILRRKGNAVATVQPHASVADLLVALKRHNIGAMVVMDDSAVAGIVSERDVVRRLVETGPDLLERQVATIMTPAVVTCGPTDTVDTVQMLMTERRVRHVPVIEGGRLAGIVSIGDIVKSRISQLEDDREQLEAYIFHQ